MDIEFWTSLIKTPEVNDDLKINCTHVTGKWWIFEGSNECLDDFLSDYEIISEGAVPCLGDLSEVALIEGCEVWFGEKVADIKIIPID